MSAHLTTPESGDNEWYTPRDIIEAARECMGAIDLDPATCAAAQRTVQAGTYYTIADDGLARDWHGRVWLNPPYDRKALPKFIDKLFVEIDSSRITEALVIVNNITETRAGGMLLAEMPRVCFPFGRVAFTKADGTPVKGNPRGQMIFHWTPRGDETAEDRFYGAFRKFGPIR
jgi:ParB family chromosome partitioning protein